MTTTYLVFTHSHHLWNNLLNDISTKLKMQIIYLISKLINHWMAGLHNLKTILSSCSSYLCINWIGLDAVPLDFCIPEWSTKICKKCNLEKLLYMFAVFLANSAISLYEIPIGFQLAYTQKASCTRPSLPGSN